MKIVCCSDTHCQHQGLDIPECDVLIHSGDWTWDGNFFEVKDFLEWLIQQPAKHKLFVSGNHELSMDPIHRKFKQATRDFVLNYPGVTYLENSGTVIDGINFWGTPFTPFFHGWAFNGLTPKDIAQAQRGEILSEVYNKIPLETNVIICHGPPFGIVDNEQFDERLGAVEMRKITSQMRDLRLYVCGHLHGARGHQVADNNTLYVNASSLDRSYSILSQPFVIELIGENKHATIS